jgi:transposase
VVRPFAIGRKNWIFSDTQKGADASATVYSIIESSKANGLNPYNYLVYLFKQLPNLMDLSEQSPRGFPTMVFDPPRLLQKQKKLT